MLTAKKFKLPGQTKKLEVLPEAESKQLPKYESKLVDDYLAIYEQIQGLTVELELIKTDLRKDADKHFSAAEKFGRFVNSIAYTGSTIVEVLVSRSANTRAKLAPISSYRETLGEIADHLMIEEISAKISVQHLSEVKRVLKKNGLLNALDIVEKAVPRKDCLQRLLDVEKHPVIDELKTKLCTKATVKVRRPKK